MRAVATALNTSPGSLYRYVASRDDILDLITDRVLCDLRPFPDVHGDWLNEMLLLGRQQLNLFRRHPWLLDVTPRSSGVGPNTLAWFDNCLRVLQPVHCSVATKFEAIAMMTGTTTLFARSEASPPPFAIAGFDLTAYPHLAAAFTPPAAPTPPQDLFERTLRSLLVGLLTAEPPCTSAADAANSGARATSHRHDSADTQPEVAGTRCSKESRRATDDKADHQ
jgi:AcrR family transcriptional regulator